MVFFCLCFSGVKVRCLQLSHADNCTLQVWSMRGSLASKALPQYHQSGGSVAAPPLWQASPWTTRLSEIPFDVWVEVIWPQGLLHSDSLMVSITQMTPTSLPFVVASRTEHRPIQTTHGVAKEELCAWVWGANLETPQAPWPLPQTILLPFWTYLARTNQRSKITAAPSGSFFCCCGEQTWFNSYHANLIIKLLLGQNFDFLS